MKTKLLKLVMPMAALILAIGTAFALNTATMETDAFTPEYGYVDGAKPCSVRVECDTEENPICRDISGTQAFGLDEKGDCVKTLYMPQ